MNENERKELLRIAHGLTEVAGQIFAHVAEPEAGHLRIQTNGRIRTRAEPWEHLGFRQFVLPTVEEIEQLVYLEAD